MLENGIRYAPEHSSLDINLEEVEDGVSVAIGDTGKGISEVDQDKVVDRGYQGKQQSARGAGLGLAIVKRIVELHGSSLSFVSTPGKGTVFRFTLRFDE